MSPNYVDVVAGTRPEIIKVAPVVRELAARGASARLVLTGQHRSLVDDLLDTLDLGSTPTVRLDVMRDRQRLSELSARLLSGLDQHVREERPAVVLVQGDTTSALCATLAAFHEHIPVGHIEAGLRSGCATNPFPEEMNRRLISHAASWHFCPTDSAAANLLREGVDGGSLLVTGNTSIDALRWVRERGLGHSSFDGGRTKVLVTLHRRENQGDIMHELAVALAELAAELDLELVLPLHPSPAVRDVLVPALGTRSGVHLVDALDYVDFVATMADADLIVTDSGGVQEEAPALDTPVLVVRETTERPEAVEAGCARLVGVVASDLVRHVRDLVANPRRRRAMVRGVNPFGDGYAAQRIVRRLLADRPDLASERVAEQADALAVGVS